MTPIARNLCWALLAAVFFNLSGCGRSTPSPPRTGNDIKNELISLDALYITEKTKQRVVAPGGRGRFVDPKTSEICWPA